jgi:hypothetical protein
MGRRCHPEKETGLASVGVIVPSAETFLMVQERCPSVLLNSIKKSKESSIHQKVSYFQCWLKELCGSIEWTLSNRVSCSHTIAQKDPGSGPPTMLSANQLWK